MIVLRVRPFCPQALSELSESPEVITQKPSFIVFMEGGDKDEQVGKRVTCIFRNSTSAFGT